MRGNGVAIFSSLPMSRPIVSSSGRRFSRQLLHDRRDEIFRQHHQVVESSVGDLGLHHPELREVPPRLRLLRAKRRPEAVHLAQRHRGRFDVELARLRQVCLLLEVVHRKQRRRAFARRRRQNRRIGQRKATLIEEVARRLDDLRTSAQYGGLPRRAHPQVPVLHQEVDAVFFRA